MAYPITNGAIAEVSFEGFFDDQYCMTILHYKMQGVSSVPDGRATLLALLAAIDGGANVRTAYAACLASVISDWHTYGQWISPLRYAFVASAFGPWAGMAPDPALPSNAAIAITKIGELANRHNIGTTHMPVVPREWVAGSQLVAPGPVTYDAFGAEMVEPVVLGGGVEFVPVIYNRLVPSDSPQIRGHQVQTFVRTMHRRTVGLGI